MSQQTKPKPKPAAEPAAPPEGLEDTIAYLAKRHRVSPAIVREIAELHRASIDLFTGRGGKGSLFRVSFGYGRANARRNG